MVAQFVNFLIVLCAIYFLAIKPLRKLTKERNEEITTGLRNAQSSSEILAKTEKEYNDIILKAKSEANQILVDTKNESILRKNKMLEDAKSEVDAIIVKGKQSLLAEKETMINESRKEIASLVLEATKKIINKEFDESQIEHDALQEIGKM